MIPHILIEFTDDGPAVSIHAGTDKQCQKLKAWLEANFPNGVPGIDGEDNE